MKGINYGRFISVYQSQDGGMYYNLILITVSLHLHVKMLTLLTPIGQYSALGFRYLMKCVVICGFLIVDLVFNRLAKGSNGLHRLDSKSKYNIRSISFYV